MIRFLKALFLQAACAVILYSPTVPAAGIPINSFMGNWASSSRPYAAGNVVAFRNNTWLSLVSNNNNTPSTSSSSGWRLLGNANAGGTWSYKVGSTGPGGGKVFFVDTNDEFPGFNFLEAAPEDVVINNSREIPYCANTNQVYSAIPGATGAAANALGRGRDNTTAILAVCPGNGAAKAAVDYRGPKNQTDWYLPSEGELMLMYTKLFRERGEGAFDVAVDPAVWNYWSSSQFDQFTAWAQSFSDGGQIMSDKLGTTTGNFRVRPVRRF